MRASLAELTEEVEDKIIFVCPEKSSGQTKKLFRRIGLSPILQKRFPLCDLCVSSESSLEGERAVKF